MCDCHMPFFPCYSSSMFRALLRASNPSIGKAALRSFATSSRLRRPVDMEKVDTSSRLEQLRGLMKDNKVDIYSTDPPIHENWCAD